MKIKKEFRNIALIVILVIGLAFFVQTSGKRPFAVSESNVVAGDLLVETFQTYCSKNAGGALFDPGDYCRNILFLDKFTCSNGQKFDVQATHPDVKRDEPITISKQFNVPANIGTTDCQGFLGFSVNGKLFLTMKSRGDHFFVTAKPSGCTQDRTQACYVGGVGTTPYKYITTDRCVSGKLQPTGAKCDDVCVSTSWNCEEWNTCTASGRQTRICTQDTSKCVGTGLNQPPLTRSCVTEITAPIDDPIYEPPIEPPSELEPIVTTPDKPPILDVMPQRTFWDQYGTIIIVSVGVGVTAWIVVLVYYSLRRKR